MIEIYKLKDKQKEDLHCLYCGKKKPDFQLYLKSKYSPGSIHSTICKSCLEELKEEFRQDFNYLSGLRDTEVCVCGYTGSAGYVPAE